MHLAASYVIHISVDGLRPDAVTALGQSQLPNFYRLRTQGAFTDNARTDYDNSVTLPNHTTMVTGRPLLGGTGHNYSGDGDPAPGQTLHTAKGSYVASVWDVVHDNGLHTGIFASKAKFVLYDQSYDADTAPLQGGGPDVTGVNNGRDKIDAPFFSSDESAMTNAFVSSMGGSPMGYSMVHYAGPDLAGHASGWMGSAYMAAVRKVDAELGKIFSLIGGTPALSGRTAIILTADHGGAGTAHHEEDVALDYTIPFYVWGPGVTAGADLYAMNPTSRRDPGGGRPNHAAVPQPIRTGDVANLALDLLSLPSVPGSVFNASQNLVVDGPILSTRPAAPTNLVATAVSGTQINLTWVDNANNDTGYKIERSTDGVTFYPQAGTGPNGRSHANTNLTPGRRYYYRVYAVNAGGASAMSNVASAVTGQSNPTPGTPATPSALSASAASASQINLTWRDNATNETGYRVERSPNGTTWTLLSNLGVNRTSHSVTGLSANTRYHFRVQALGSSGNSGWSNVANATTQTATPNPTPGAPAAPTLISVVPSTTVANAINVTWSDNANNESGYKVERSTDGRTFSVTGGTGVNGNFHRNGSLTAGKRYYYRVYAWNASGNSARSAVMSAVAQSTTGGTTEPPPPPQPRPPATTLAAPTLTSVLASTTVAHALNLTWRDNSVNESGFKIERSTDGRNFFVLTGTSADSQFQRDSNLTAGKRYYYRVYAWDAAGRSAYSDVISAVAP